MVSPMMPHLAEELWKEIGNEKSMVCEQEWPKADEKYLVEKEVKLVIQINGKKKFVKALPKGLNKDETEKYILEMQEVKLLLREKKIKNIIVIPEKILNIVM